jgi:CYTH domain-containing protein
MHEIERKFLVYNDDFKQGLTPVHVIQGYLLYADDGTARVRIVDGTSAVLSIKKDITDVTRWEFEYVIPVKDAEIMIKKLCNDKVVEKKRYFPEFGGKTWDVDEFLGANEGLVIAEIELDSEDDYIDKPAWAGEEVTHDKRYLNAYLAEFPYTEW